MFINIEVHDHVCMVYGDRKSQLSAITQFMKIGLRHDEKCICITDEDNTEFVLKQMNMAGINTDYAMDSGSLSVMTKHDSYLKQECFDPDRMIRLIQDTADKAKANGFKALRVIGDASWALDDYPGVERLLEYESKVNSLFENNDLLAICQYDQTRFSPDLIESMIKIHPCCLL